MSHITEEDQLLLNDQFKTNLSTFVDVYGPDIQKCIHSFLMSTLGKPKFSRVLQTLILDFQINTNWKIKFNLSDYGTWGEWYVEPGEILRLFAKASYDNSIVITYLRGYDLKDIRPLLSDICQIVNPEWEVIKNTSTKIELVRRTEQ